MGISKRTFRSMRLRRRQVMLLRSAWNNGDFYRTKWLEAGINERDLDHIPVSQLPEISRTDLKSALENPEEAFGQPYLSARWSQVTSGSSGIPVEIRMTVKCRLLMLAAMVQSYRACGLKLRDVNVTIKDPVDIDRKNYAQRFGVFRHDYYSIFDPISETAHSITSTYESVDVLKSMPSDLLNLMAFYAQNPSISIPKIRRIFSDSEHLDPVARSRLQLFFGAPLHDFYSSTELGIAAYQPVPDGPYHVCDSIVALDFVPDASLNDDNLFSVIGTNYINFSTPIIRYQIGDIVHGVQKREDGSQTFAGVHGKFLDFLMDGNAHTVSSHTVKQDLTAKPYLVAFRIVQESDLSVKVYFEKDLNVWNGDSELDLLESVRRLFKTDTRVILSEAENLRLKCDVRKFKVVESLAAQEFLTKMWGQPGVA